MKGGIDKGMGAPALWLLPGGGCAPSQADAGVGDESPAAPGDHSGGDHSGGDHPDGGNPWLGNGGVQPASCAIGPKDGNVKPGSLGAIPLGRRPPSCPSPVPPAWSSPSPPTSRSSLSLISALPSRRRTAHGGSAPLCCSVGQGTRAARGSRPGRLARFEVHPYGWSSGQAEDCLRVSCDLSLAPGSARKGHRRDRARQLEVDR